MGMYTDLFLVVGYYMGTENLPPTMFLRATTVRAP